MKKLLALALSLVMLLAMIPMAGAATFTDTAKITMADTEAVNILSDMKIITGFPEGDFRPEETLTRAQAAKILCCTVLGVEAADALPAGGSTFGDVPASHWSNKYVEYCASKGIVAGTGAGKFNPNGKLTGYAFGKMLLVALGADAASLTGANWDKNTKTQMLEKHLDYGVTVGNKELNRQDACRLALNTLFYGESDDVEATLAFKVFGIMRASAGVVGKNYGRPLINYISANEDAYWPGTEKKIHQSPDYFVKSGAVKGGDVVKKLGVSDINADQIVIYRNGTNAQITAGKNDYLHTGETKNYYLSGNGVQLEFYHSADTDKWTIIHMFYYPARVSSVTEAAFYSDGSVETPGSVTFDNGWSCASNAFKQSDVGNYACVHGIGKKTMNEITEAVEAIPGTVVEGVLSAYDKNNVTVGGKTYKFPAFLGKADEARKYLDNGGALGDTVKVLLSDDNFVIMVWKD